MKRIGIINRGEPAIRFLNALDALRREEEDAPESVALYTDADLHSVYVRSADRAVRIGNAAQRTWIDAVIKGLEETECDAAWLGWGFAPRMVIAKRWKMQALPARTSSRSHDGTIKLEQSSWPRSMRFRLPRGPS